MSQQEDDLRALARIMDFLRAISILLAVVNLYWFCPELRPPDGWFAKITAKVLNGFQSSCGMFNSVYFTKWFSLLLLATSCFGTKGVKNQNITWRTIWALLLSGMVLFFSRRATGSYMSPLP